MSPSAKEVKMIAEKCPHGLPGQINRYVKDVDSSITGYGKHNRLIVFRYGNCVTIREDKRNLPLSTEKDRRKVLASYQNPRKEGERLTYLSTQEEDSRLYHEYRIEN